MVVRLLVCDPAQLIRAALCRLLDDAESVEIVGGTGDGLAALEAVDRLHPDVVLLDAAAGRTESVEIVRKLAEKLDPGRGGVIVLGDEAPPEAIIEIFRSGARGFLLKQDSPDDILYGVRKVAEGGGALTASVLLRLVEQWSGFPLPASPDAELLTGLTAREREVLRLVAAGCSNAEIATTLWVQQTTVKSHVSRMLGKLGLRDRVQAAALAHRCGLVVARQPVPIDDERLLDGEAPTGWGRTEERLPMDFAPPCASLEGVLSAYADSVQEMTRVVGGLPAAAGKCVAPTDGQPQAIRPR